MNSSLLVNYINLTTYSDLSSVAIKQGTFDCSLEKFLGEYDE